MQRTQISFEPAQHAFLIEEARRQGTSMAELVRRLVDKRMLEARQAVDIFEELAGCAEGDGEFSGSVHDKVLYDELQVR